MLMGKVVMDMMFTWRLRFGKAGENVIKINGAIFRNNQRCLQCVSAGMKKIIMYIEMSVVDCNKYIYFHFKCIGRVLRYCTFLELLHLMLLYTYSSQPVRGKDCCFESWI